LSFVWESKNFIRKVGVFTDAQANKKLRIASLSPRNAQSFYASDDFSPA
jgi:hypothetical protein